MNSKASSKTHQLSKSANIRHQDNRGAALSPLHPAKEESRKSDRHHPRRDTSVHRRDRPCPSRPQRRQGIHIHLAQRRGLPQRLPPSLRWKHPQSRASRPSTAIRRCSAICATPHSSRANAVPANSSRSAEARDRARMRSPAILQRRAMLRLHPKGYKPAQHQTRKATLHVLQGA